jgi:Fe-S oxidoreductase
MDERFSVLRIEDALSKEADILASTCPYCLSMFTDSLGSLGKENELKVFDLVELLAQACLGPNVKDEKSAP